PEKDLGGEVRTITLAAFAPDGRTLALGATRFNGGGVLRFLDPITGLEQASPTPPRDWVTTGAFSPSGRLFAGADLRENAKGSRNALGDIRDLYPERAYVRLRAERGVEAEGIQLWDRVTGREWGHFPGDWGFILRVAFSPDGRTLAAGSEDGAVRL